MEFILFQGGKLKNNERLLVTFKNIFIKDQSARKANIRMEASSGGVDSSLYKLLFPGVEWSHNEDQIFR